MSSRAKKKAHKNEQSDPTTAAADPPVKEREPAVFTILGLIVFFAGGLFAGAHFFDSWTVGLGCGVAAFILGAVLVWRGESLVDGLSGL